MSPRAAWRLESLGFGDVYEYKVGKLDWLAAGLPTEGTNAQKPRAGALARKDVPTCRLDERLGDVRGRAQAAGWDAAVVVNSERVVFGLLRSKELAADGDQLIAQVMRPAPSTFRPYVLATEMAKEPGLGAVMRMLPVGTRGSRADPQGNHGIRRFTSGSQPVPLALHEPRAEG